MNIEVSIGEIVDKLSILKIKKENIINKEKLKNIIKEHDYLNDIVFNKLKVDIEHFNEILLVNKKLWLIEDEIRDKEKNKEFDSVFIELARQVYITNDIRAGVKKKINEEYGSNFVEEKSYSKY